MHKQSYRCETNHYQTIIIIHAVNKTNLVWTVYRLTHQAILFYTQLRFTISILVCQCSRFPSCHFVKSNQTCYDCKESDVKGITIMLHVHLNVHGLILSMQLYIIYTRTNIMTTAYMWLRGTLRGTVSLAMERTLGWTCS